MNQNQRAFWIDSHCHIDKLGPNPKQVVEDAKKAGLLHALSIGTEPSDWGKVLQLAQSHAPFVYGALGMHPHTANLWNEESESFLRQNLISKNIVALGEIGLDNYYKNSDPKAQEEVFEKQLSLACALSLPVQIHSREAEKQTLFILNKFKGRVKGLIHCFSGSWDFAKGALDLSFNISFSGILTFKNAGPLREICQKIPLDRIHIETDAPFLSPEPLRGKENRPAHLPFTAKVLARLHSTDEERLSERLKQNAYNLFSKIQKTC